MSLFKRAGSPYYWIKLSHGGRRLQKSTGTADRRKAQQLHDRLKADLWNQVHLGEKPRHLWEEAVLRHLEEASHKRSLETDRWHLRWLHPHLEGMPLAAIDRAAIERLVAASRSEGVKSSTTNRRLQILRLILRKAHLQWEWIETVPRIVMLKEPKGRTRFLSHEEACRLLQELPPHLAAMVRFSLSTGLRQGNVKGLEWARVDLERRMAWVPPDQAKAGVAIAVPLNDEAIAVLEAERGKHERYVFTYRDKPIRQVSAKAWRKALKRAGIEDFRWHDLRHTWASWHAQNGTPLLALQELGGWNDAGTVRRYSHLAQDHLRRYADAFADSAKLSDLSRRPLV